MSLRRPADGLRTQRLKSVARGSRVPPVRARASGGRMPTVDGCEIHCASPKKPWLFVGWYLQGSESWFLTIHSRSGG